MDLAEQLERTSRLAPLGLAMSSGLLRLHPDAIVDHAMHRVEHVGYPEYGSKLFERGEDDLVDLIIEALDEAADLLVYMTRIADIFDKDRDGPIEGIMEEAVLRLEEARHDEEAEDEGDS